jgi:ABC-type multidrug transport system ATPase subunit
LSAPFLASELGISMSESLLEFDDTGTSSQRAAISAKQLYKSWPGAATAVLAGVTLEVDRGAAVSITGRNGSGKTTLLRILAGLIGPSAGSVKALGLDPFSDRREYHRRVGFLSAGNVGLYARLTVREQLALWGGLALLPSNTRASRIATVLREVDLEPKAEARTDRLSLGQRQRLRIALTLLPEPSVYLLDEPTTSLDDDGASRLAEALLRRVGEGASVIWAGPSLSGSEMSFVARYALTDGLLGSL